MLKQSSSYKTNKAHFDIIKFTHMFPALWRVLEVRKIVDQTIASTSKMHYNAGNICVNGMSQLGLKPKIVIILLQNVQNFLI